MPDETDRPRQARLDLTAIDSVLECAPLAIVLFDTENRVTRCNREAERIFGWTEAELLGRPLPTVPAEFAQEMNDLRARVRQGEIMKDRVSRRLRKDGTSLYVRVSMAPLIDSDGNVRGHIGMSEDITSQVEAEQRLHEQQRLLKESNEFLDSLIKASPVAIMTQTTDGSVMSCNPAWQTLYGWTEAEVLGGGNPTVAVEREERVAERRTRLANGQSLIGLTGERRRKDGSNVHVRVSAVPLRNSAGEVTGILSMTENVTEQIETEHALLDQHRLLEEANEFLRAILNSSAVAVTTLKPDGTILSCNPAWQKLYGWSEAEVIGKPNPIVADEDIADITERRRRVMEGEVLTGLARMRRRKDGSQVYVRNSMSPLLDSAGHAVGLLSLSEDITAQVETERALSDASQLNQQIIGSAQEGVIVYGPDLRYRLWNPFMERLTGYPAEEVIGRLPAELFPFLGESGVIDSLQRALAGEITAPVHFPYSVPRSGRSGWTSDMNSPLRDAAGEIVGVIGTVREITDRKMAEVALLAEKERYQSLLHNLQEGVWEIDTTGRTTFANKHLAEMLGYAIEEMIGRPLGEFLSKETASRVDMNLEQLHPAAGERHEAAFRRLDGSILYAIVHTSPILDPDGIRKGTLASVVDISDRRLFDERLRHMSFHDGLLGLYNRAYFEDALARLQSGRQLPLSIIMGDVNGLKLTNDAFGHEMGDVLLRQIAEILKRCCRSEDIVARWGGDEFAVLLPKTSEATAHQICQRIQIECANATGIAVRPSIALGVSTRVDISMDVSETLRIAEDNMYRSKLMESKSTRSAIVAGLLKTLSERAYEAEEHTRRLEQLIVSFGRFLGRVDDQIDNLVLLAALHDVGKIAVPDSILLKTGVLTAEEWVVMKRHSETGYRIAESMPELVHIAEAVLSHHERWDGSGYPRGLVGDEIPITARILSIVDAYDAVTTDRSYRKARSHEEALGEIDRGAGTQFDPDLVRAFLRMQQMKAVNA